MAIFVLLMAAKTRTENPPNIVLIMTDQQRFDTLGCMGNNIIKTPYVDQLAAEGVVFNKAYTASPSCTPARAGLLTGLSPWHHGMLGYSFVAKKYKYELPRMLRDAGYYTFGIGKMHWHPQRNLHGFHGTLLDESGRVEAPGFISDYRRWFKEQVPDKDPDVTGIGWNENRFGEYALPENLHPTSWTGEMAVHQIKDFDKKQPLFLKVSFARPHSPYDPPSRFMDMYDWREMPVPFIGDWAQKFNDYKKTPNPAFGNFGIEFARKARAHYYANISFIDEQVGKIIAALKERGMYENSLIIFTADHGDMLGDHHHWRKTYAYEGSAHIPMVLRWPSSLDVEISPGSSCNKVTELRDILPTFLDIAGQAVPDDMDGRTLLNLIRNPDSPWRDYIDFEHAAAYFKQQSWQGLTDGRFKYIYFRSTGEELLFNLTVDPGEEQNLASDPKNQEILEIWRSRLIHHFEERGSKWVKNGELIVSKKRVLHSPNFPAGQKPKKYEIFKIMVGYVKQEIKSRHKNRRKQSKN